VTDRTDEHELVAELLGEEEKEGQVHGGTSRLRKELGIPGNLEATTAPALKKDRRGLRSG
jgi:hypothetical protein